MTEPQQASGWSDPWPPDAPQPAQPPAQSAYDPYGQAGYHQPPYSPPTYGQPPYGPPAYGQPVVGQPVYVNQPTNGMAIASLICSLAGLAVFVSAPVGAVLGHVARKRIRETGEQGDGMALAGIIVGWVITGLGLCACLGYLGVFVLWAGARGVGAQ